MNKVFLYTVSNTITAIDFLFFDSSGVLQLTLEGTKVGDLWEATISSLASGSYTVVGKSQNNLMGKEEIEWNGTTIVPIPTTIAQAVKTELSSELIHLVSLQNGLTSGQATMLLELYNIMGLDPLKPLIVSSIERKVGTDNSLKQSIQNVNGVVTLTRIVD